MNKLLRMFLLLNIILLSVTTYSFAEEPKQEPSPKVFDSAPEEYYIEKSTGNGLLRHKITKFSNGDQYWINRLEFDQTKAQPFYFTFHIIGKNGMFTYVENSKDGKKEWKTVPLKGTLPKAAGFVDTDKQHLFLSYPTAYKTLSHQTIQEMIDHSYPIQVKENSGGYTIIMKVTQDQTLFTEFWGVQSSEPLVDWNLPNMKSIWLLLDLYYNRKWSWDGIYEKSPSSYHPTGANIYYRFPDNYVARSFVITGGSRMADDFGWVMMKQSAQNQGPEGIWKTAPRSEWLWKDYGIDFGFYDTRFNNDQALLMLKAYQKYGEESFLTASKKQSEWFLNYIEKEHTEIISQGQVGWLVPDYTHEMPHERTHTSLNHQLAEINYLLELFIETEDTRYEEAAHKLLNGIKNVKPLWIKDNQDLWYAYFNGEGIKLDYPYLTYNDLVETQRLLQRLYGSNDPDLDELMASKRAWMDKNGVTAYRKW